MKRILLVGIFLLSPAFFVHADPTEVIEVTPSFTFPNIADYSGTEIDGELVCPDQTGRPFNITVYEGFSPDASTPTFQGGYVSGGSCNGSDEWLDFLGSAFPLEQSNSDDFPDGNYWIYFEVQDNPAYFTPFVVNSGVVSPGVAGSIDTRIIDFAPNGVTTASTTVDIDVEVFFNDSEADFLHTIIVEIDNIEAGYTYFPLEFDINCSAFCSYSTTTLLNVPGQHYAIVSFRDSAGHRYKSKGFQFTVLTSQYSEDIPPFSSFDPEDFGSNASSTSGFFAFLNVPNLLKTKIPFSYGYELYEVFTNLDEVEANEAGQIILDFSSSSTPLIGDALEDIELFSTSTVTTYLNPTLLSLIRGLVVALIWTGAGFHLYLMGTKEVFRDAT